jgi:hypothetical protein
MRGLIRTGCAFGEKGRGVSGNSDGYISSQGRPERTNRESRMLHNTGNSSIQLFQFIFRVTVGIVFLISYLSSSAEEPKPTTVGAGFEQIMFGMLYQQMRSTNTILNAREGDYFAPSNAEKIYRDMLDQMMISQAATRNPIGVGKMVDRYLAGKGGIQQRSRVKSELVTPGGQENGRN